VLAGGTLTGKYARGEHGRAANDDSPGMQRGKHVATRVGELAAAWGVPAAHVAFGYAFAHRHLASIVFGASSAAQLGENAAAWTTFVGLSDDQRAEIVRLGDG
jgi:aryl-alcohol dehydrogenase-like predicted oxidoreductase